LYAKAAPEALFSLLYFEEFLFYFSDLFVMVFFIEQVLPLAAKRQSTTKQIL
jgi:hypothetical protein